MKQLITKFKLASVFALVLLLGCETDDNVLLPQILSSFTYTLDEDTGTVEFINISERATSYQWDFGDGETSTEINPIKTYMASGTYTITLTVSNTAGATSTFEDEITIVVKDPITLPITFDEPNVNYDLGISTFSGTAFEIVDNPDESGTNNTSSKVGAITNSGAEFEGVFFDLGTPIDLSNNQTIQVNFWSQEPIDLLMKLELGTGSDTEVTASHDGTGWETVSFDFTSTETFSRVTFFVDGPGTTAGDFYIDDVEQVETTSTPSGCEDTPIAATSLPVDFEGCETFLSSENFGDGITSGLAQNPDKTGINTSDFVLQVDKPAESSFFAGIQNTFENNFDLTTTDVFRLKVYSTKANVVFRFELALNPQTDPVTGNPAPVFVTIPNANEWTEVEVKFTGLPGGPTAYNQLVIKPDNDEVDSPITEDGTYYIDDITLGTSGGGGGGGASLDDCGGDLVNDFETDTDAIFDNFGGGVGTIIDNPDTSVNTSAKVGQYVKNAGEVFGGVTIEVDPDIDFDSGVFSIDVYSEAVRQLLFKLEGLNIEVVVPTSGTGWETLTYDFSSVGGNVGSVTAITLIMDNGTQGDGSADWTIQFDNIRLCSNNAGGGGGGGASLDDCGGDLVNDFETDTDAIFDNFGGGVGTIIDNPDTSVNTSAKVGQYVKNAGEVFGGVTIEVDPDIDFDSGVFSIDVYSEAVRQLLFKLEGLNIEVVVPTSGTGWETLTYDFSSVGGNVGSVTAITLIMDNGTQGDGSVDWTIQFDNIRLCSNNAGGGGGGGASLDDCGGDLVNDFETDTDAIFNNFGGGVGTIIDNPDTSVNTSAKVGQYVKNAGEVFGGVTIEVDPDIDFDSGVFSIDVYSEAVRQLLFKLEGLNIEVVVPTSGTGWETLTYDFSSVGGNVGTVTAITLIMDNGTQGDGSADWTIQFDNIRLCSNNAGSGGGGSGPTALSSLPADFESGEEFGGVFEPASVDGSITANPVSGGINTSANVYTFNKPAGTEFYGGMENVFATPLDLTTTRTFRVKVYSTKPNIIVQFELQSRPNDGSIPNYSIQQTVTNANEWVELTFDFGAIVPGDFNPSIYNAIVIIPDFDPGNNPTATSETYYIDDLILE